MSHCFTRKFCYKSETLFAHKKTKKLAGPPPDCDLDPVPTIDPISIERETTYIRRILNGAERIGTRTIHSFPLARYHFDQKKKNDDGQSKSIHLELLPSIRSCQNCPQFFDFPRLV